MAEFKFEQDLGRALLREQYPDLADLELRDAADGWDSQEWRLGAELAVRLPRTHRAAALCARDAVAAGSGAAPAAADIHPGAHR